MGLQPDQTLLSYHTRHHPQIKLKTPGPSKTRAFRRTNTDHTPHKRTTPYRTHTQTTTNFFTLTPETRFQTSVILSFHNSSVCQPNPEPHLPPPDCAPPTLAIQGALAASSCSESGPLEHFLLGRHGVPHGPNHAGSLPVAPSPTLPPYFSAPTSQKRRRIHAFGRMGATLLLVALLFAV